jgi:outer membrane lipoprotein-sorting protein
MTRRKQALRRLLNVASIPVMAALSWGCAATQTTVKKPAAAPAPLKTATKADLIARYNRQANAITSLNASVTMTLTAGSTYTGVIKQYHQVSGFILAQKPSSIRVIGQAPVVGTNIFDMESDGETFNIFIPSQNKFLTGPANLERPSPKPIENLRPQHLTSAVFWNAIPDDAPVLMEEAREDQGQYYILTIVRLGGASENPAGDSRNWQIGRKVWFDRADLSVARIETYGAGGVLAADVRYANWDSFGAVHYPRQITISRPASDYTLQIGITKLTLNEAISADRFALKQPPGTQLVRVDEETGGASR